MNSKHIILARSLSIAVVIAMVGGYLNDAGARWFPHLEKYVDNVVAIIIVMPLIYFVFVPAFRALTPKDESR